MRELGNSVSRLALGTVQFGLDYGVSNTKGKTSQAEAAEIVRFAASSGIDLLDTAAAYGSAEEVLGAIPEARAMKIVTKLAPCAGKLEARQAKDNFRQSLELLHCARAYGLLVHRVDDLLGPGGEQVWRGMSELREEGLVEKIGISVYEATEIHEAVSRYDIDLVQLPINVFDQRLLVDGTLERLHEKSIEVHARSAFLQGLIFMDPSTLPAWFDGAEPALRAFHKALEEAGSTPLCAAVDFAVGNPLIDRVVVGAQTRQQLEQTVNALAVPPGLDYSRFRLDDSRYLDPRLWQL